MKILDWLCETLTIGFIAKILGILPILFAWMSFNPLNYMDNITLWTLLWMCIKVEFWMWVYGVFLYIYIPMIKK